MRRKIRNSDVALASCRVASRLVGSVHCVLGAKKRGKPRAKEVGDASRLRGAGGGGSWRAENGRRGPKTFDNTCKLLSKIE